MKLKIREAIRLAEQGATSDDIRNYFQISEEKYRKEYASFSPENRKKLRNMLISNGLKGKSKKKESPKTIKVWDTSYVLSAYCRFDDVGSDVYILAGVYEQLSNKYTQRSKKVCRFFHSVLDGRCKPTFIKERNKPKDVPYYQDEVDAEILEFCESQNSDSIHCVIYTSDKDLAIRAEIRGIEVKFFDLPLERRMRLPFSYDPYGDVVYLNEDVGDLEVRKIESEEIINTNNRKLYNATNYSFKYNGVYYAIRDGRFVVV